MTLSWKDVPLIQETDHITYILIGREKENRDSEQVVLFNFFESGNKNGNFVTNFAQKAIFNIFVKFCVKMS